MRACAVVLLVLLVLVGLLGRRGVCFGAVAVAGGEEEAGAVALSSLTEDQVDQALDTMTTATLVQIIESQGYGVEEGTDHAQVLEAAKILVKQERERQLAEKRGGSGNSETVVKSAQQPKRAAAVGPVSGLEEARAEAAAVVEGAAARKGEEEEEGETESESEGMGAATVEGWNHKKPIPEGATFWDLFFAQVASDLGPVWRIIPEPVRLAVAQHSKVMAKPLRQALCGAVGPMLKVASKMMVLAGKGLVNLGGQVSSLSLHIATLADGGAPHRLEARPGEAAQQLGFGRETENDEDYDVIEI